MHLCQGWGSGTGTQMMGLAGYEATKECLVAPGCLPLGMGEHMFLCAVGRGWGVWVQGLGSEEFAACEVELRQLALSCLPEGVVEAAHIHPFRV